MTKRKATCEHGQRPEFCSRCAHTALLERVIEACARMAVDYPRPCTEAALRRAVLAAGRRAASGEVPVSQAAGPVVGRGR